MGDLPLTIPIAFGGSWVPVTVGVLLVCGLMVLSSRKVKRRRSFQALGRRRDAVAEAEAQHRSRPPDRGTAPQRRRSGPPRFREPAYATIASLTFLVIVVAIFYDALGPAFTALAVAIWALAFYAMRRRKKPRRKTSGDYDAVFR